jgi:hypothetical protein
MRPGAPRLAEFLSCHLVLVLLMCRPGLPADQQGTKKSLTIGYLAALTVSTLLSAVAFISNRRYMYRLRLGGA